MKKFLATSICLASLLTNLQAGDCVEVPALNVEFKNDSTIYSNDMEKQKIEKFANFIKKHKLYTVIEGHTSSYAPAEYNYDLSTKRALKVRAAIIDLGVSSKQVRAMGFGESSPLYDNQTAKGASKNRRVLAEVFDNATDLSAYVSAEKSRIKSIRYKEQ